MCTCLRYMVHNPAIRHVPCTMYTKWLLIKLCDKKVNACLLEYLHFAFLGHTLHGNGKSQQHVSLCCTRSTSEYCTLLLFWWLPRKILVLTTYTAQLGQKYISYYSLGDKFKGEGTTSPLLYIQRLPRISFSKINIFPSLCR